MAKKKESIGGRPPIYKTPAELQKKIDEYFKNCPDKKILTAFDKNSGEFVTYEIATPIISGLVSFLGFESRQSFYDYEAKSEFSYTIKKARLKIETEYEKQLYMDKCTGAIFALKNLGWKDTSQKEITGKDGEPLQVKKVFITAEEQKEVKEHIEEVINARINK